MRERESGGRRGQEKRRGEKSERWIEQMKKKEGGEGEGGREMGGKGGQKKNVND